MDGEHGRFRALVHRISAQMSVTQMIKAAIPFSKETKAIMQRHQTCFLKILSNNLKKNTLSPSQSFDEEVDS